MTPKQYDRSASHYSKLVDRCTEAKQEIYVADSVPAEARARSKHATAFYALTEWRNSDVGRAFLGYQTPHNTGELTP